MSTAAATHASIIDIFKQLSFTSQAEIQALYLHSITTSTQPVSQLGRWSFVEPVQWGFKARGEGKCSIHIGAL